MSNSIEFSLLYDGHCPICCKEVAWLRRWNRWQKLALIDIQSSDFNPSDYGLTHDTLMARIHGVYPDGRIITGMAVFRETYRAIGLCWLMTPTGWPLLSWLFDTLYDQFAKHRIKLGKLFGSPHCIDNRCMPPKRDGG